MKLGFAVLMASLCAFNAFAGGAPVANAFPTGPNLSMTPGVLCHHADEFRYPEHIPYCRRDVDSSLKDSIIHDYDKTLGYSIEKMPRQDFKIDHFIPLCMGGANEEDNLWPQHKSVYEITDPMEPLLCGKMSEGKLKQADAIALIKRGKLNLSEVPKIIAYANKL